MMIKRLLILLCLVVLQACNSTTKIVRAPTLSFTAAVPTPIVEIEQSDDGCLLPLAKLAFPYGETNIFPPQQEPLLPPSPWSLINSIPDRADNETLSVELIRYNENHDEIWLLSSQGRILIYQIDTKKWIIISPKDSSPITTGSILFLDKTGQVWAARKWTSLNTPLLGRYNEFTESFEPITNEDKLFEKDSKSLDLLHKCAIMGT